MFHLYSRPTLGYYANEATHGDFANPWPNHNNTYTYSPQHLFHVLEPYLAKPETKAAWLGRFVREVKLGLLCKSYSSSFVCRCLLLTLQHHQQR